MMGCVSWNRRGDMLLIFSMFMAVRPSLPQPPLPLSLPVHMSVVPPPWHFLPLSQAELGPLFSNSSPFSSSKSLFMVPPPSWGPTPGLQASFGPYVATQLVSESVLPLSPPLSASLLSEHVERETDEGGPVRFRVRTLFHKWGDSDSRRTCITLHAFKDTEEHKASCTTQPPLGLCVVTLTLPGHWFHHGNTSGSHQHLARRHGVHPQNRLRRRERQKGRHHQSPSQRHSLRVDGHTHPDLPQALRNPTGPTRDQVQLYYSTFDTTADLELTTPGCVLEPEAQTQRQLAHIRAVEPKPEEKQRWPPSSSQEDACLNRQQQEEEEELSLDSHVVIRYHKGPVLIGQPVRMSVTLRSNFTAEFVIIRLKVKKGLVSMVAQRTLTSDLWAVTLERSQGSRHDVVSILCHKHSALKLSHDPTLLQQVVCLSVSGLRQSFGVAMTVSANWWVEYSGSSTPPSPGGGAVSSFSFADRNIVGIAPITESNKIINTAILTNQPVSLPVIVLAISQEGKVSDVTSAVTCHSTNENTLKVSSDCSALFVDGSESGLGNTCAVVEFVLGTLSGSVCVEVWAPSVPLRVSLSDPVLNAISGWRHFTDNGCEPVYQRSTIQVLTQFRAQDARSRTVHLLNSSDWFVDVTDLVRDWLRVEDPAVASLGTGNNLIGLQPGKTSLYVVSEQWDGVLGRCDITVTSDPVSPADLSVQVVSGLGMSVTGSPTHPAIVTATVTAYNILYNHHQEASISIWLQFSDDTASLLSTFSDLPYFLRLSSLAESVVLVTPGPRQRIFAQGDGGGPLLRAELLVSTCTDEPITSNLISEGNTDWTDTVGGGGGGGGGGRTRRLASGSGWIRVNLDLGFLQPAGGKGEEFELDISDMLVDSESNVYASNFDDGDASDDEGKWNGAGDRGMVSRNNLERAVLMPGHDQEQGSVYFSPSQEREDEGGEGIRELEVGVGAVLSLLCLSAVLFLANCLPCALRDKRRAMAEEEEEEEEEEGGGTIRKEEEEEEEESRMKKEVEDVEAGKRTEGEEEMKQQQQEEEEEGGVKDKEDIKEVEIIC